MQRSGSRIEERARACGAGLSACVAAPQSACRTGTAWLRRALVAWRFAACVAACVLVVGLIAREGVAAGVATRAAALDRQDRVGGGLLSGVGSASAQREVWVEVIESFTLPDDPEWMAAALEAEARVRGTVPPNATSNRRDLFRIVPGIEAISPTEAARIAKQIEDLDKRIERAKSSKFGSKQTEEQGVKRVVDSVEKIADSLRATAGRPAPLTVVRLWDGIERREMLVALGRGQRALANRLVPGKPVLASIGPSAVGEDLQARRETVKAIQSARSAPSEFLRVEDGSSVLVERGFGEVDSRPQRAAVVVRATKDPAPGSGVLTLELPAPPEELGIDAAYPWYAEFKLFELGKDGARAREVSFKGIDAIVAAPWLQDDPRRPRSARPSLTARGRVEVKSPVPWGYEAVVVKWYGVAAKDRLVTGADGGASSSRGRGAGGASKPAGSADPAETADPADTTTPLEETAPPALPDDPQTPGVPESRR
jgi:hypothetical protein